MPPLGDGHDPGPQPLAVGRSLHARADERREKLCPAIPGRRADGWRSGRRGGREQGRRLRARRPRAAHGRLARRGGRRRATRKKLPDLGAAAAAIPRHARGHRSDRLFRPARRRLGQGRRHRVRVRRRWRGRLGGGPDRQGQGHDRDRLGRRRRRNASSSARSAPTRSSITRPGRSSRDWPPRRPTASTSISTMSAATISMPRSRSPGRTRASRSAG